MLGWFLVIQQEPAPSLSSLFGKDAVRRVRVLGLRSARNLRRNGDFRFDLGIGVLKKEWRGFFSPKYLREDLIAGATVACVALPLSLAIALASGITPGGGLITAIVAGILCAFFGGTRLAVSGPAAAMSVLIATAVDEFGMGGLLVVGLVCGILQFLSGIFGLGRFARFVPVPVISGFTAGIGAIILIGQLPRALGISPPDQAHVLSVVSHLSDLVHETNPVVVLLTVLSIFLTLGLPKIVPRLPAPLVAVVTTTLLVAIFGIPVPLVGVIPDHIPLPSLPDFTAASSKWASLIETGFIIYVIGSLETLLSSSAIDKLAGGERHDPNQELVGQGIGNMAVAFFGGIPITGVIARSALNVRAGARTRRSSIFHALLLLACVYFLGPLISQIPIAALAGILLSIAIVMMHPKEFLQIWRASRSEAAVYGITFLTIVFVDLIAGVQAGIIAAAVIVLLRVGHTRILLQVPHRASPYRLSMSGSLSFLSNSKIEKLRSRLKGFEASRGVVIDMSRITSIDTSGGESLLDFFYYLRQQGAEVILKGLSKNLEETLLPFDRHGEIASSIAFTESEVHRRLQPLDPHGRNRILFGVERFQQELRSRYEPLFERLGVQQNPHTLFITCSDSRINPCLVTSTDPGELFIVRNAGNLIPRFGEDSQPLEGASLEFALGPLEVSDIIICGHTSCGAIKSCLSRDEFPGLPNLQKVIQYVRTELSEVSDAMDPDEASRINVRRQMQNILTYPIVQKRLQEGKLHIYGWLYNVSRGEVLEWSDALQEFAALPVPRSYRELRTQNRAAVVTGKPR